MRGGDAAAGGGAGEAGEAGAGRGGPAHGTPSPPRPRLPLKVTAAAPGPGESDPEQGVLVPTRDGLSLLSHPSEPNAAQDSIIGLRSPRSHLRSLSPSPYPVLQVRPPGA